MAKEKVYKLAQEFKVSSEALVQMLRGMGIPVKSHMSTVDENLRDEIKKKFESERASIKREYERKKQLLTKAREDLIGKEEEAAPAAKETPAAPAAPETPPIPEPAIPAAGSPATAAEPAVKRETPVRHAEPFRRHY
jgi:hypothetical protein